MLSLMKVLRCMLVGRIIATANVTARETQTKVDPLAAHFEAFFAPIRSARRDVANLC
jgi:hypothetical protein